MDKEIAYPMEKGFGFKEMAEDEYADKNEDDTSHTHAKAKCMTESENG